MVRIFGYLSWFFIINLSLIKRLHDRKKERRLYFFLQTFEKLLITWYFSKSSDAWSRKIHLRHWLTPVRRFLHRSHLMIIQIALYFLIILALYFLLCTDAIDITHLPIHKYTWGYRARVHVIYRGASIAPTLLRDFYHMYTHTVLRNYQRDTSCLLKYVILFLKLKILRHH